MSGVDWNIDGADDDGAGDGTDETGGPHSGAEPDRPANEREVAEGPAEPDRTDGPESGGPGTDPDDGGWTRLRRLRVGLGVGAFATGVVLVAGADLLALAGLAGVLGGSAGRALVVLLGLVAGVQGLWAAVRARADSPALADPPDPEPVGGDRPPLTGGEFDAAVERLADPGRADGDAGERVRKDLRRTAVTLLVERTGCTRAEAATRVTRGDWTDDPRAAAFLGGPGADRVPMAVRVREWLAPETPAGQRARRAADHVVALAEDEP